MSGREDVIIRFGGDSKGVNKTLETIRGSVTSLGDGMRSAMGVFGGVYAGKQLVDFSRAIGDAADNLARLNVQIGKTGGPDGLGKVIDLANQLGMELNTAAEAVNFFAPTFTKLGYSFDTTVKFIGDLNKSMRVYGVSAQGAASITTQLSQAFSSGQLSGDELKSLSENAAGLYGSFEQAVQEILGSEEALKKLGSQGVVTSDVMYEAFQKTFGSIRGEMEALPDTMAQMDARLSNAWKLMLASIDESLHQSDMWKFLSGKLTGVLNTLGIEMGSVKAPVEDLTAAFDAVIGRIEKMSEMGGFMARRMLPGLHEMAAALSGEITRRQADEAAKKGKSADPVSMAGPSAAFKKALKDRQSATLTAAQAEAAIWKAYSNEINAVTKKGAEAAQKNQEDAFKALAKAGASDSLLTYYENLVGEIGEKPIKAKMEIKVDRTEIDQIPAWMKASLEGQGYTISVGVIPQLLMTDSGEFGTGLTPDQAGDVLSGEVDRTGANP